MNWYIGQEIVCVKSHSKGVVKEGNTYIIEALKKGCCFILLDVGFDMKDNYKSGLFAVRCPLCKKKSYSNDNTWWLSERLFAPLGDISELKEILKEQPNKIEK